MDIEKILKFENGNEDSENILYISANQINYYKFSEIYNNSLEEINNKLNILQEFYENNLKDSYTESNFNKVNSYFKQIHILINSLTKEKDSIFLQYESILRKNEQKIRLLYNDIFYLKIRNNFLENNIENFIKKEEEYKIIKEKTGLIIDNGNIIYNNRKDNEIFILRQENSTLKTVVNKNEIELMKFKKKYENDKINLEKTINLLNHKISLLKFKLKQKETKQQINSKSDLNLIISKGKINNRNKKQIDLYLFETKKDNNETNKKPKSVKINDKIRNIKNLVTYNNKDKNNIFISHCPSSGFLDFKNKIKSRLNILRSRSNKISSLNFQKINKTNIDMKKIYLTPRNQISVFKRANFKTLKQMDESKKTNKIKYINKDILKTKSKDNNININNNKISKEKINHLTQKKNNKARNNQGNVKGELNLTQNLQLNNSIISSSPIKINKIYVLNHNIKKEEKDFNVISNRKIIENIKKQNNISNNSFGNYFDILNKLNISSIRKRNKVDIPIHNYKTYSLNLINKK